MNTKKTKLKVFSLWDIKARRKALGLIQNGSVVASYNRGVCAMWGDGRNTKFISEISRIKGQKRVNIPIAACFTSKELIKMVDLKNIHQDLHNIFLDAEIFTSHLGSLCFIRVPITEKAAKDLPQQLISRNSLGVPILQNWDPSGHVPIHHLISSMIKTGLIPAVTSLNQSGFPEIVDQDQGIKFCEESKIEIFLEDRRDKEVAKGSYTILEVTGSGLGLVREGHIPKEILSQILKMEISVSELTKPAKFPTINIPDNFFLGLKPKGIRTKVLHHLSGKSLVTS